jgi:hypothetical protein
MVVIESNRFNSACDAVGKDRSDSDKLVGHVEKVKNGCRQLMRMIRHVSPSPEAACN